VNRRRFLSGALGVSAAVALGAGLSGCGSAPAKQPLGAPVAGGARTTPNRAVRYPKGYVGPIASEKGRITKSPAELRVLVMQSAEVGDYFDNRFTDWYEKRTGVKVKWQVIAAEDSLTKINAMIASGDVPDVMMPNPALTPSQVRYYGEQGMFRKLNGLIEDYGTETQRIFRDYPNAEKTIAAPDGSIYCLPNINDCYQCASWGARGYLYQPWLDKLKLDMPESTAEFEEVLKAFKHGDPNGDGKKDQIVPFAGCKDAPIDQFFMSGFLYNPGGPAVAGSPWLTVGDDKKLSFAAGTAEWREGLRYMHRLAEQGLIDRATFTQTTEQLVRLGDSKKPRLGASVGGTWGVFLTIEDASKHPRYADYPMVPALKGPDGTRIASWDYGVPVQAGRFMITKACKNPEIALMWGDGLFELEATERSYTGPMGKQWKWSGKGQLDWNGLQSVYDSNRGDPVGTPGNAWAQQGIQYRSRDYRSGGAVDPKKKHSWGVDLEIWPEKAYQPYRQPREHQLPRPFMTADQVGETAEIQSTVENHVKNSMAKFVLGQYDPNSDSDWKDYLDTLDRMNIDRLVRVHQAVYDAKYA
jgi:putative aldouronate transport system substrate-binding protein